MQARGRIKPGKAISAIVMVWGIIFIGIGMFVVIPRGGLFGVFWTLGAVVITIFHAVNLFSATGVAHEVVDFETNAGETAPSATESIEQRLEKLDDLRANGLINETEYQEQRKRILGDI